jgi:hypothetical protein
LLFATFFTIASTDCSGRPQDVQTVAAAHLEIAEHDVELPLVELLDRHVAVRRLFDLVLGVGQRAYDSAPQRIVIVCNEYPSHVRLSKNRVIA